MIREYFLQGHTFLEADSRFFYLSINKQLDVIALQTHYLQADITRDPLRYNLLLVYSWWCL